MVWALSRSPRVEALNSQTAKPLSILHHATGTIAHGQFKDLAAELLLDVGYAPSAPGVDEAPRMVKREAPEPRFTLAATLAGGRSQ